MSLAWRFARRELRAGLSGFWIFLICLALGVTAIAAVGTVRSAIQAGLSERGAELLGGDAEVRFTYRFASEEERLWLRAQSDRMSEIVDFRSMLTVTRDGVTERGLTQVKGVDGAYPLIGQPDLEPQIAIKDALGVENGLPGIVMAPLLADRLALSIGDRVKLGTSEFQLRALLLREPDSGTGGFGFGPRSIVALDALKDAGLLAPGTLFDSAYRLDVAEGVGLSALKERAESRYGDSGLRWRDSRNAAPGAARFIDRMGSFLVLVGLAGLAVGGVGISAAIRAYLDRKLSVIATLKTLGASGALIFRVYLLQIGVIAAVAITAGLILGGGLPLLLGPLFQDQLPVPVAFRIYPLPLLEAAVYGALTALIFSLWPLARARDTRAAQLFRDGAAAGENWPRWPYLVLIGALVALLISLAVVFTGVARLALGAGLGTVAAVAVLALAASLIRRLARHLSRGRWTRGRPTLRLALSAIGGPGSEAGSVVLSLGLGLTVLAAIGQVDSNFRRVISAELPDVAPAFFFVDIQNTQLPAFMTILEGEPGLEEVNTAPMLRGVITGINGQPAKEVAGNHWVLRGDRGLSYAATPPKGTRITDGEWWPKDYAGPPLVSFAAEEGAELGLSIGDKITVNVLGRDMEFTIHSFREVDFRNMGINFIMITDPNALLGAPHTHIATVYAGAKDEAQILRSTTAPFPNITAISVRDAIATVTDALGSISGATRWAALVTLVTGFVVLIGAAAAGEARRVYEAALLKTLGASRARILLSFALRSAILGAAAGCVAIFGGAVAGYGVMVFVMDAEFSFDVVSALTIILSGAALTLIAGLFFAWRPLRVRPARILRNLD